VRQHPVAEVLHLGLAEYGADGKLRATLEGRLMTYVNDPAEVIRLGLLEAGEDAKLHLTLMGKLMVARMGERQGAGWRVTPQANRALDAHMARVSGRR
jgi:hypothetical protein